MNATFVKALFDSVVKDNLQLYRDHLNTTEVTFKTDHYWKESLDLYHSLSIEHQSVFLKILEQTMIDTVSTMLGVIDGSTTLKKCSLEPKLLLDAIDTKGELQELFLEFIEERDRHR